MTEDEFQQLLGGSVNQSTKYFTPKDYIGCYLFLVQAHSYDPDAPNPFSKPTDADYELKKTRREAVATITVFPTPEHLAAGEGTVLENVTLTQPFLAKSIAPQLGKLRPLQLAQKALRPGSALMSWIWNDVQNPEDLRHVKSYLEGLMTQSKAETASQVEAEDTDYVPEWLQKVS